MWQLTVSEEQYLTTTDVLRQQIYDMAQRFAVNAGIDWEFEYRWMTMSDEDLVMASLTYPQLIDCFTRRKI